MNRRALLLAAAALLFLAEAPRAAEDHRPYRSMVVPECNECHREADVTPNHLAGWNTEHARLAGRESNNCAMCHDQGYCADCHQGGAVDARLHVSNVRGADTVPRSHRSDFREIHPIAAMDGPRSCEKCHEARFCSDCHAKYRPEELQFESHRRQFGDIPVSAAGPRHALFPLSSCATCHPKGSALPSHEWGPGHAREAKRNLAACQSCHADGETCLKCHSARQGLVVKPHPDNWDSIKGNLERASGRRTCVRCH